MAYQTDGAGNKLATFTYDANGTPESVVIGSGTTTPRYYYMYNGHGEVVALVDSVGTVVASYSYDAFGNLTASSENLPNGWSNPYRYDGAEGVRYDSETGLYWLRVRAYDPTLGRFLSHDPLGRLAAWGVDFQPYVYASNNPVVNTDPSGLLSCRVLLDGACPSYWTKLANTGGGGGGGCSQANKGPQACNSTTAPSHPADTVAIAQSIARMASKFFNKQAELLLRLAGVLAAAAVTLMIASDVTMALIPVVAGIPFAGPALAIGLEILANVEMDAAMLLASLSESTFIAAAEASIIGQEFYQESLHDRKWWTKENVASFGLWMKGTRWVAELAGSAFAVSRAFGSTILKKTTTLTFAFPVVFVNEVAISGQIDSFINLEEDSLDGES